MNVRAAILTYKPEATGRLKQLVSTWAGLFVEANEVWIVDNGSGADEVAAIHDAFMEGVGHRVNVWTHSDKLHTSGHGTNLQARILAGLSQPGDICVLSDDDMAWRPRWRDTLQKWWEEAPADVILTGCHLEPPYPWSPVEGRHDFPALYRGSTGAASWSYRAESHSLIFPIPERVQGTGDVPACTRLRSSGRRIAQLDLADHVGQASTWGNRTASMYPDLTPAPVRDLLGAS